MTPQSKLVTPNYALAFLASLFCGFLFYGVLYFGLLYLQWPVERILGIPSAHQVGPDVLIYVFLYVLFFWGLFAIVQKGNLVRYENSAIIKLSKKFQSHTIISKRNELDNLRAQITQGEENPKLRHTALIQTLLFLIEHCLVTQSSERVLEIFTKRMATLQSHIESSYNMLRYIAWGIPSLGFIGTVLGIGQALAKASQAIENIDVMIYPLGMAFDTTFIALLESMILMFFMYYMQNKEESMLSDIDMFCQEKFIINLRLTEAKYEK